MKINWNKLNVKEIVAIICNELDRNNVKATLVGGACVSIYTNNKYESYDLDFVTNNSLKEIEPILEKIGFKKRTGRIFKNKDCKYFIDFPAPPLCIGNNPVKNVNFIKTNFGIIRLLTPTDCVKDRLLAYYYWNDIQSLEQAILVSMNNKIDMKEIKVWAVSENNYEKYLEFMKKVKKFNLVKKVKKK